MHAAFDLPGASLRLMARANVVRRHNPVEAATSSRITTWVA